MNFVDPDDGYSTSGSPRKDPLKLPLLALEKSRSHLDQSKGERLRFDHLEVGSMQSMVFETDGGLNSKKNTTSH